MTHAQTINTICRDLESGRVPNLNKADAATILKARLVKIRELRANIAATKAGLSDYDDRLESEDASIVGALLYGNPADAERIAVRHMRRDPDDQVEHAERFDGME